MAKRYENVGFTDAGDTDRIDSVTLGTAREASKRLYPDRPVVVFAVALGFGQHSKPIFREICDGTFAQ